MVNRFCFVFLIAVLMGFQGVAVRAATPPVLKTGVWRAVLQRPDGQQIVFNFISAREKGRPVLYVINATEKLLVDSIVQRGDSLWIQMPFFASGFAARIKKDGNLEGLYIKHYGDRTQEIPFFATYGDHARYPSVGRPNHNLSGKWDVRFPGKDDLETRAIGEFEQTAEGRITGTFLTPTGDYRYLEGTVSGDTMRLSGFDGGHAISFVARMDSDSSIRDAVFYSGLNSKMNWTARKDNAVELPDSYQITRMRPGETSLNFRFVSTSGDTVSIQDPRYKNKVVIVQILGSWCPNCMDETAFLSAYYKENRDKGVEIIGLAYERTEDYKASKQALIPFQKRFDVHYPFLITGVSVSDEKRTEKTLPQIDAIKAFPTTLFVGRDGKVAKIHTGYNGPGTGVYYEEFKKEFDDEVKSLLSAQ
jgi:thiol-disulfide isomerase/thioredoxin